MTISWVANQTQVDVLFPFSPSNVAESRTVSFPGGIIGGASYNAVFKQVFVVPAEVTKVSVSPTTLAPFQTGIGTVILDGVAGPSGRTVTLSSNDLVVSVPTTVVVPSGQRRANFVVTDTSNVGTPGTATISAQIGTGASSTGNVNYSDFRQISIIPSVTSIVGGNQLGFIATTNAALPTQTALGFDWSGFATGAFPSLVLFPANRKTVGFSVVPDGVDTAKTLTVTGQNNTAPFPTATVQILPASLASVELAPTFGGLSGTGTVRLNGFAGPSGAEVTLEIIAFHADVPPFVTIPPNKRSVTFTYTTTGVDADESLDLRADYGTATATTLGTLRRATAGALVPSTSTSSGGKVTFTLKTNGSAGESGTTFNISSDNSSVVVPGTVKVLPGKASATFVGTVTSTGTPTPVTITATVPTGVGSVGTTITVN
jgi:hypothetical protein